MKSIFTFIAAVFTAAIAATFIAGDAQSQSALTINSTPQTLYATVTSSATNNYGANLLTNWANNYTIDAAKASVVALEVSFNLTGAGSTNVVMTFAGSVDTTNFETSPLISWGVAPNGTTQVRAITNITVGAIPYFKFATMTNGNDKAVTNFTLRYNFKR